MYVRLGPIWSDLVRFGPTWSDLVIRVTAYRIRLKTTRQTTGQFVLVHRPFVRLDWLIFFLTSWAWRNKHNTWTLKGEPMNSSYTPSNQKWKWKIRQRETKWNTIILHSFQIIIFTSSHCDNACRPQVHICPIINTTVGQANGRLTSINWPIACPVIQSLWSMTIRTW